MIITIVGGGSTFTPGIVKSIAKRKDDFNLKEIRLFDIDKERQDKVAVVVKWILEEDLKTDILLTVTYDEKEAYDNADFIFAQMRVGKYAMRLKDEVIPMKYGCIGQETCGAGGLAYALRTIDPMIHLIDTVEKYAKKDHWILNYSNPASIVAEACQQARPNARIINICDMPIAIIEFIAKCLEIENFTDIKYDYFGLNHFGWFTKIWLGDRDILAEAKKYIMDNKTLLPLASIKAINKIKEEKVNRHMLSSWLHVWDGEYEIIKEFDDYLPNTYLNYYLRGKEIVEHVDINRTRAVEVMETREKDLFKGVDEYLKTGVIDEKTFYAGSHGDWMADLALALKNDTQARFLVITKNRGTIPNIDPEAMVEVPAYIGKSGPEVISQNKVELFYQGMMNQQIACEKLLVEAHFEGSYKKLLQAFTLNKTIPSMEVAKKILDEMIIENQGYFREFK